MAASQCAPDREDKWAGISHRIFSSITPGEIAFWGSKQISTGRMEQGKCW
jgi:hypothetical protein